jgi:hypothetical protein
MQLENMRVIDATLRNMPADDRVAALIVACVEYRPHVIGAILTLISTIKVMARALPQTCRIALAENLRDLADEVERRPRRCENIKIN